jgi:hypothetical protein
MQFLIGKGGERDNPTSSKLSDKYRGRGGISALGINFLSIK